MSSLEIFGILALIAVVWLWLDSLRVRELAIRAARAACTAEGLMLLDDTVAIASLKAARNDEGRLGLRRVYSFEYSDNGNNRIKGSIVMLGHRVMILNVGVRSPPSLRIVH